MIADDASRWDPAPVDLDQLPLPLIELTSDAQALQANEAYLAYTGIERDRIAGTGWFASLSPDRRPALFAALQGGADFALELRLLRADGIKAWVQLFARWLPDSDSFLCLLCDTTANALAVHEAQAEGQRFRLLADNVPVLIAYYQRNGFTCVYANNQYARTFGLNPQSIVGLTFAQVIGDEAAREIQPHVDVMLRERRTVSYVRHLTDAAAADRWIEVSLLPHRIGDGTVVGSFVLINDVTRHRRAEFAAQESEERLAKFMDASLEGIAFHVGGVLTDVNAPMAALLGLPPDQLRGRDLINFVAPTHRPGVRQCIAEGREQPCEATLLDADGQPVAVELIARRTRRAGAELSFVVVRDVRDREAARARIRELTQRDALTGLWHRSAAIERLQSMLAAPPRGGGALAVLRIDLDRFRRINDAFGHAAGDALLRAVAARLVQRLPADAVVGRCCGDEFIVLLADAGDRRRLLELAETLRAALSAAVEHDGRTLSATPTIGVARYPDDGVEADALLRHADAALHAGKRGGRDCVAFYTPQIGIESSTEA